MKIISPLPIFLAFDETFRCQKTVIKIKKIKSKKLIFSLASKPTNSTKPGARHSTFLEKGKEKLNLNQKYFQRISTWIRSIFNKFEPESEVFSRFNCLTFKQWFTSAWNLCASSMAACSEADSTFHEAFGRICICIVHLTVFDNNR